MRPGKVLSSGVALGFKTRRFDREAFETVKALKDEGHTYKDAAQRLQELGYRTAHGADMTPEEVSRRMRKRGYRLHRKHRNPSAKKGDTASAKLKPNQPLSQLDLMKLVINADQLPPEVRLRIIHEMFVGANA